MLEQGRSFIMDLSRKIMTPGFLAKAREDYIRGFENLARTGKAFESARQALSRDENVLADRYEILYLGGQRPNMTDVDEERLISQISARLPGGREAFEKRDRLYNDEALQQE